MSHSDAPEAVESALNEVPGEAAPQVQDAADDVIADRGESAAAVDESDGSVAEIVFEADPILLAAVDQARAALAEIAPAETVGEVVGHAVEGEHVLSLFFASKLAGYPDWHWTATLARVSDSDEPTVLEVEMLPGEGSVLSPAWVPWADRLTADAIIDDSESEFDDDDVDEESGDESGDGDDGDLDDPDDDGSDDEDDAEDDSDDEDDDLDDEDDDLDDEDDDLDDEDSDDELDDEEVAALALRRDRDGIDIDTIAEDSAAADPYAVTDPYAVADDDSESPAEAGMDAAAESEPTAEADTAAGDSPTDASGVDPDAGSAFDETDDFTDAGDIEGRDDDEPGDPSY